MNSSADIKAFCGRHGGVVCTSSNAKRALEWAFERRRARCSSCPTSTWAATPPCFSGHALDDCVVYDPRRPGGGLTADSCAPPSDPVERATARCTAGSPRKGVDEVRAGSRRQGARPPGVPARGRDRADLVGSTEFIIRTIEAAPAGSTWAVGTELNLVKRLADAASRTSRSPSSTRRLLLRDDEPDRPAAPGLGAGEPRRRGRQPDHGRPRYRALRARSALQRMLGPRQKWAQTAQSRRITVRPRCRRRAGIKARMAGSGPRRPE